MTTSNVPLIDRLRNLFAMTDEAAKITRDEAIAELERLATPNMFWEEDCDGDNAVDDPADIADRLNVGEVFSLMCARSLPTAYFVAGVDDRGCSIAIPATAEQIAEYKAAKKAERDRRQAGFDRRNAESGAVRAVPFPTPGAAEAAAGKHTATYRKTTDGDHSIQTEQAP